MKVNLHILEACNYSCRYCFAKFGNCRMLPLSDWKRIVANLKESGMIDSINLAGGEPLLYPQFLELCEYIREQGFLLSVITNGSLLTPEWLGQHEALFDTIGISVPSFQPDILHRLGQCDKQENHLSKAQFDALAASLGKAKLKVNTVVSRINLADTLAGSLPEGIRWKILKMDVFTNEQFDNSDLAITDEEFQGYLNRNVPGVRASASQSVLVDIYGKTIVVESDVNASYLMVDANGCLVDDSLNDSLVQVADLRTVPFVEAFARCSFNEHLYLSRYAGTQ